MKRELEHLLLVTVEDPFDPKCWSGIPYSLRKALERRVTKVTSFQPSRPRRTLFAGLRRLLFGAQKYPLWITRATLRNNATEVQAEIFRMRPDAVLSLSSQCVTYLADTGTPAFFFSDAPYLAYSNAYARWDQAPLQLPRFAKEEARAARRLQGIFFGSDWACEEAAHLYNLSQDQAGKLLHVAPLGANWVPTLTRDEVLSRVRQRDLRRIELLFVGRDWERKGGPLAVEIALLLQQAGHPVMLHIVGCRPALESSDTGTNGCICIHGLLQQNDPQQNARLAELFLSSHFLLVPTLAECFGIVFAEAQAYALPPISRAVHALPSIIEDGVTGMLLDPDAGASTYVERILMCVEDSQSYRRMASMARERFEQVLNWDRTAATLKDRIELSLPDDLTEPVS